MDLAKLAEALAPLNYVLMRNFDQLPPAGDMDFFVSKEHRAALEAACRAYLGEERWFDIRTPGDNYYPRTIEQELLKPQGSLQRYQNGFKIPTHRAHFLSLYYHGKVHKGDARYDEKLEDILWEWLTPPRPNPGVGYHKSGKPL